MNENLLCEITPLKKGIVRISRYRDMPESYLEKYSIIDIPSPDKTADATIENGGIILPNGKKLVFETRPDGDNDFWREETEYLIDKFKDHIRGRKLAIEGRPEEEAIEFDKSVEGWASDKKFGISFEIDDDELFYGLGEAKRDGIELRGGSYQNWAMYQYNEVAIPLVISNKSYGIFIAAQDRHFVDIDDRIKGRLTIAGNFDLLDVFVLYGDSMKDVLRLYTDISGKSMLLPKWAYGLTYIAPLKQNQFELLDDMMKFREKHIPCDNVSLEPGWMEKNYDYSFDKKWNQERFHMGPWMRNRNFPKSFPAVLRRFGFHMALWMCMNYDLCDEEERQCGGEGKLPAWYDHVKQFVNDGADGFKIDPADMIMSINPNKHYTNGETELSMHNVSQVLVMKQMHNGFAEQTGMRPYIHYSGGYTGQQHWGAATTGDNGGLVGSMIWLENLAMSGFMNSTVDMDIYNPEAIHFAMFAPWAHHNAWSGCGQPWYAGPDNERIYIYYARLRYSFIPYIYSCAVECAETGVPMIRPMPLQYQYDKECASLDRQYMLGDNILISAFTDKVYLPEGKWIDCWTGEEYGGGVHITYTPPKDRGGAFFIKKGSIIPKWCDRDYTAQYSDEVIQLHFYPDGKSEYIFREDDGISLDYRTKMSCRTLITCEEHADKVIISIGNREGEYNGKPEERVWEIYVHDCDKPIEATCDENAAKIKIM